MLSWLLVESLEWRWLLEDSLVELEVVVVGKVMKEWYIVKGAWLEGLINLGVDLCHQQLIPSLEREEVEVKFCCHLENCNNYGVLGEDYQKVEYGVSTSIGYGVSNSLSNTAYSSQQINTAYPLPFDTAYRSRHFKTQSLDELRLPDFNLLSDQEYSEEEEVEAMVETMEQYMSTTRTDYGSGVARPKIDNKDQFKLKGQFLKELRENTFSSSDNEDANEHIE
ncbi:hypothetical protein Tco_0575578, partial [Tanacetum coccineum]